MKLPDRPIRKQHARGRSTSALRLDLLMECAEEELMPWQKTAIQKAQDAYDAVVRKLSELRKDPTVEFQHSNTYIGPECRKIIQISNGSADAAGNSFRLSNETVLRVMITLISVQKKLK